MPKLESDISTACCSKLQRSFSGLEQCSDWLSPVVAEAEAQISQLTQEIEVGKHVAFAKTRFVLGPHAVWTWRVLGIQGHPGAVKYPHAVTVPAFPMIAAYMNQ